MSAAASAGGYNASKGALIALTQALAIEWGKHNINVNTFCPGYFPTKLSAGLAAGAGEIVKMTPLVRAGGEYRRYLSPVTTAHVSQAWGQPTKPFSDELVQLITASWRLLMRQRALLLRTT